MTWPERILLLVLELALLAVTFALIRKRRLREVFAALWVIAAIVLLVLTVVPTVSTTVGGWVNLDPAVLLLTVAVVFLVAILLCASSAMTREARRREDVAREVADLKNEVDRLRERLDQPPPPPAEPKPKPPSLRT